MESYLNGMFVTIGVDVGMVVLAQAQVYAVSEKLPFPFVKQGFNPFLPT